jgi:polyhydroxybutyrate depolymerase|nr:PHB depolymerase family esterase [Rhodoferax sp.]
MTLRLIHNTVLMGTLATALLLAPVSTVAANITTERVAGRDAVVHVPSTVPAFGSRALVVVLHGGLGNAQRIASAQSERFLGMHALADEGGFVVAYLNGTPVARMLGDDKLGWNAGSCCGQPAEKQVDDVAYIQAAVAEIATRYGVDRSRVFGMGHSNGAMLTQRVMCETSVYAAAVPISGGLENGASMCPAARGKRIMAIHGADDQNVPVEGGKGARGLSRVAFNSEAATAQVWKDSGAQYDLQIIPGASHGVDSINAQLVKTQSQSLAQKIARFFGLLPAARD